MDSTDPSDLLSLRAFSLETQTTRRKWLALAQYVQYENVEGTITEAVMDWQNLGYLWFRSGFKIVTPVEVVHTVPI